VGGLQVGYNWQWGNWLAGFETDFDGSALSGKDSSPFMLGPAASKLQFGESLDWFGTMRARIGPKLSDNMLTYVTAGLAYGSVHDTARLISQAGGGATAAGSSSSTAAGWSAGTGLEFSFWTNLTVRLEYLYMDLGSGHTANAAGGAIPFSFTAAANENNFHIFRFGLNYQFNQCCEPIK
jgi:outer membrane immunogenic protein